MIPSANVAPPPNLAFECADCHRAFKSAFALRTHRGRMHKPFPVLQQAQQPPEIQSDLTPRQVHKAIAETIRAIDETCHLLREYAAGMEILRKRNLALLKLAADGRGQMKLWRDQVAPSSEPAAIVEGDK